MKKFNLLSDDSSEQDYSIDKTHENISNQLNNFIVNDNEHDLTIGVEGSWGTGKSTVIKLLKKKLAKDEKIFYFYIDAWAHEGDHLRRIFLEKLINEIERAKIIDEKTINEFKNKVRYKQKTTLISKLPEVDIVGKISAVLAFCIPVGTVIIEETIDEVTIGFGLPIHKQFVLGLILTIAPLIPIVISSILCFILGFFKDKSKKIKSIIESLKFFKTTDTDTTTETTNEVEKSSVDFENLFKEIERDILIPKYKKFICVIDNLDRINETDALKIWSTLQTFMQKGKKGKDLQKIFIIPYDEKGLKKLWYNDVKDCSKSFFDKSFQLRLTVPPFSISGWEQFAMNCLLEAFPEESFDFRNEILEVLKWTRKNLHDGPSPREIKNYINQVGFLYPLFENTVSLTALCYYVIIRFIDNVSTEKLKEGLIDSSIPDNKMRIYTKFNELPSELSAILYNVPKVKGMELLLAKPIIKCIEKEENVDNLLTIQNNHKTIFNSVLLNIMREQDTIQLSDYFIKLYKAFSGDYNLCKMLCNFIYSRKEDILYSLPQYSHEAHLSILHIMKEINPELCHLFIRPYETFFENRLLIERISKIQVVNNFVEIKEILPELSIDYNKIGLSGIYDILQYCTDIKKTQNISECFINLENIDEHIANNIDENAATFDKRIPEVIELISIKNPLTCWTKTLSKIIHIIQRNNLQTIIPYYSLLALQLSKLGEEENTQIATLIHTERFWNSLYLFRQDKKFYRCSYLLVKYTDLNASSIPNTGNTSSCFNTLSNFICSDEENDLEEIFYLNCIQNKDFSTIWKLSKHVKFKLFKKLIEYVKENNFSIFDNSNKLLEKFSDALQFFPEKQDKEQVFEYFESQTDFIETIINTEQEYLAFPEACLFVLQNTNNKTIQKKIRQEMAAYEKSQWDNIFKTKSSILQILSYFAINSIRINELKNNYCDSFTDYIIYYIKNKQDCPISEESQVHNYCIMSDSFQKDFSEKVANEMLASKFIIPTSVMKLCTTYLNCQSFIKNKTSEICEIIEEYVDSNKPDNLLIIESIIHRYKSAFVPDKRYTDTLSEPFMKIKETINEEYKNAINELASYFSITFD